MSDFKPGEWASILAILRPKPAEADKLRRTLLSWREYAQERAGIRVDRNRKALADLTAARDALAALAEPLARLQRDAAPGMNSDVVRRLRQFGPAGERATAHLEGVDSLAMISIRGAAIRKGLRFLPTDKSLQRFAADAERLRQLADDALRSLGTMNEGRPAKGSFQRQAIRALASMYEAATGERATSTETRPFAELVRIVLRVVKAGELIRASLPAAKRANSAKTRANARSTRG